jgi:fucose permease
MAGMILILVIAQGLIPAWGGVYILSSISAHSAFGGLSYAVYSGAMAMGRLSGDYVVGVVGATRVLIVSPLVAATGMLAAALARSPVVALSSFALVGIGLSCVGPLVYTVAGNSIGKSVSGGVASVAAVGQIGEMIGPAIIGRSAEHVTFRGVFLGASVMTLMLSALAWLALFASRSPMHLPFVRSSP